MKDTVTPTPGTSQSISDLIDALEFEDEDGVKYQTGFLEEADASEIIERVINVISTAKAVVAFNPEAISAFGNATHGVDTFCTMASSINHALQVARELITEERADRSADSTDASPKGESHEFEHEEIACSLRTINDSAKQTDPALYRLNDIIMAMKPDTLETDRQVMLTLLQGLDDAQPDIIAAIRHVAETFGVDLNDGKRGAS